MTKEKEKVVSGKERNWMTATIGKSVQFHHMRVFACVNKYRWIMKDQKPVIRYR